VNGQGQPFYGKYRGIVTDNNDLTFPGRVRARVPDVLGDNDSGWAMPSVPYAGNGVGMFFIPPVGASVWIEFEHGDPDYPIWSGCFWESLSEVPVTPTTPIPDTKVLKTDLATITLNDVQGAGGITIETTIGTGAKIVMDAQGIEVTSGQGKIKLSAAGVSINDGALEVM
jgi:uncharacterized protein involved in type VI secretion and phage assembly